MKSVYRSAKNPNNCTVHQAMVKEKWSNEKDGGMVEGLREKEK